MWWSLRNVRRSFKIDRNFPLSKRQFFVDGSDFLGFHVVDLADVGLEELGEAGVVEAVEGMVGGGGETASLFVLAARAGIEALDAVFDGPLNGLVVAGFKMEAVYFLAAAPVASVEAIALGQTEG
jgi:hypothetical protein